MSPNQAAAFKQIPSYLADMAPGALEIFSGSDEQREQVYSHCHPGFRDCRLWQSIMTDEDGYKLIAVFLDYYEDGTCQYWGTLDFPGNI